MAGQRETIFCPLTLGQKSRGSLAAAERTWGRKELLCLCLTWVLLQKPICHKHTGVFPEAQTLKRPFPSLRGFVWLGSISSDVVVDEVL